MVGYLKRFLNFKKHGIVQANELEIGDSFYRWNPSYTSDTTLDTYMVDSNGDIEQQERQYTFKADWLHLQCQSKKIVVDKRDGFIIYRAMEFHKLKLKKYVGCSAFEDTEMIYIA